MKIKIRLSFLLYFASIALLCSPDVCFSAVLALVIHESGHLLAGRLTGEKVALVELTPFGGMMAYPAGCSAQKGIKGAFIAAAGPLSNYLVLLLLPKISGLIPVGFLKPLTTANVCMMVINLLPALPMDGGRIVFSIGYYLFGIAALTAVLTALGILTGCLFLLLGLYGFIRLGTLNLSMMLVGFYIIVCASKSRQLVLSENLCTLIHERLSAPESIRPVQFFSVPADEKLCHTADCMGRCTSAVFLVSAEGKLHLIEEKRILSELLQHPDASMHDLLPNPAEKIEEKQGNFRKIRFYS